MPADEGFGPFAVQLKTDGDTWTTMNGTEHDSWSLVGGILTITRTGEAEASVSTYPAHAWYALRRAVEV